MPGFVVEPLPPMRQLVSDIGWFAKQSDPIVGLLEIDVTAARETIHHVEEVTGERPSFTAFIVTCIAHAINEHKHVHAMRGWRGRLTIFDDVDVTTMVEIEADGRRTPVGLIVRGANHKSLHQIHNELRDVQKAGEKSSEAGVVRTLIRIPRPFRRALIRLVGKMPQWSKATRGTVVVTAVGMFGKGSGWGLTLPSHSLVVLVGSISRKPWVFKDEICIREILNLTLAFDHIVVDGAPAARFANRLRELIESGYGLDDPWA